MTQPYSSKTPSNSVAPDDAEDAAEDISEDLSADDPRNAVTIGTRIRAARKAVGLNQGALAARLGVSQPTVANWEADVHNPRQMMLRKLADALDVSLGWLAGGEGIERLSSGHPVAAYLGRPITHVPILPASTLITRQILSDRDLHCAAVDFLPMALEQTNLCGVLLEDDVTDAEFPGDQIFVFDYRQQLPAPGSYALIATREGPVLHRWTTALNNTVPGQVLGTLVAAIRHL